MDNGQAGNPLEVTHVPGCHTKAEFERGGGDQKIRKVESDSLGRLLTADLARQLGRRQRHGIHREIPFQSVYKRLPAVAPFVIAGSLIAVGQFHDGYHG